LAVSNIRKTITAKSWKYDPSISVPYDLKDSEGNVFATAGTRVNPLSFRSLHTALVFYDADDSEQIDWVKRINKKYFGKTKLILVNGSVTQQEKIFHQPIYFDQQGKLTTTFNITQVPAVVYQDGMELVIAEVIP
jgi:conjugal transfer pilus assembly protein TraW